MDKFILALDQGTTSSRAIVFDHDGRPCGMAQREFRQILPAPGEVEHDPEEIWSSQLDVGQQALSDAGISGGQLAAIGLTNQRETTVLWERDTGRPLAGAIVWQSRVSAELCDRLRSAGHEQRFREKTGLVIDAYFSATKIQYLLDRQPELRERARTGEVLFGTVDTWLLWKLTGGACHATDYSNASRTLLFNIHSLEWDQELLDLLDIPREMLPEVRPSSGEFGVSKKELFGTAIPITGVAGDQQAATFGQACFEPGMAKNTYGTGCFMLLNTGTEPVSSQHKMLTTIGWHIGGETTYCLEGSIFVAGSAVQWLRDGLELVPSAQEFGRLAASVPDSGGVVFVPALTGLGAPHWDSYARGTIFGITRGTTAAHLARATLEAVALQTYDLAGAMQADAGLKLKELRTDGGMSVNDELMQIQADLLEVPVRRAAVAETTALGAAYLAGLAVGYWSSREELARQWSAGSEFFPSGSDEEKGRLIGRWQEAVRRSLDWAKGKP